MGIDVLSVSNVCQCKSIFWSVYILELYRQVCINRRGENAHLFLTLWKSIEAFPCSKYWDSSGLQGILEFAYMRGCSMKHRDPEVYMGMCLWKWMCTQMYEEVCTCVCETACELVSVWELLCTCAYKRTRLQRRLLNLSKCLWAKRLWLSHLHCSKQKKHKLGNILKAEIVFLQF